MEQKQPGTPLEQREPLGRPSHGSNRTPKGSNIPLDHSNGPLATPHQQVASQNLDIVITCYLVRDALILSPLVALCADFDVAGCVNDYLFVAVVREGPRMEGEGDHV